MGDKQLIDSKKIDITIEDLDYYFFARKNYSLETNKKYQDLHTIINPFLSK